jgi:catechol 2,3-dioxygenase-like lactoylglutathione lyase family enzyme
VIWNDRRVLTKQHWRRSGCRAGDPAEAVGFGKTYPEFWINLRTGMAEVAPESGVHICLRAKATGDVDAFHAAALTAGGHCGGAPGQRPHDRVRYYAAFVLDPDGNRIEAVAFPKDDAGAG